MEKFYSKLRVVVRVITICLAMAVFTSCGEDEPSPNPDNQEQTNNPSSGGEQNNPDNSGGTQGGESTLNKYGTDMSGEELAFVGCWRNVLGSEFYLFPDGKAGMWAGYPDAMTGEEWSYDSDNKFLTTTYIPRGFNKSYQFHITGIFEDRWTGLRVGDSAGCSAIRNNDSNACLYAWLVSHNGVWYNEDGEQKKIYDFFDRGYSYGELLEFGQTIQWKNISIGYTATVTDPWGKSPKLQMIFKTGKVRTYTLKYE